MPHHSHGIHDVRFRVRNFLRRAAVFLEGLEITEARFQFCVIFRDGPRQKPVQLAGMVGIPGRVNGRKFFRMRRPRPRDVGGEIVTQERQRLRRQAVKFQILQINVMVRAVDIFQRQMRRYCQSNPRSHL